MSDSSHYKHSCHEYQLHVEIPQHQPLQSDLLYLCVSLVFYFLCEAFSHVRLNYQ